MATDAKSKNETAANVKLLQDINKTIVLTLQEIEQQRLDASWVPGYDELIKIINSVSTTVQGTAKQVGDVEQKMVHMVEQFNPKIPSIVDVKTIQEMITYTKSAFIPLEIYKTLTDLSNIQGNKLTAPQELPLTALFQALEKLIINIEKVLSNYTPDFFNTMLDEVNKGIDNAVKITAVLEPYLQGTRGIKMPSTMDVAGVIMALDTLSDDLASIDIKKLDEGVQHQQWKRIKIGLMCVLKIIKNILGLLKDVAPLNIQLGAAGGVAAGVNAEAEASASVISLGSLGWGTTATVVDILITLIDSGDAYIDLRIAERKDE